jgi:acetyltransferase-like isoleucine patch superfamily enzyme
MNAARKLSWDWYDGVIPQNVEIHDTAYVETSFSFHSYRSEQPCGVRIGNGASTYLGTMFDVGPQGKVTLGEFALVHGARIICDSEIFIGDYALISWNVVLMDTYRLPQDRAIRRQELEAVAARERRFFNSLAPAKPIHIERNVWIGFESCILPGITIGEGSIVGARSVVTENVPPFTVVAGNPARIIRQIEPGENPTHEQADQR